MRSGERGSALLVALLILLLAFLVLMAVTARAAASSRAVAAAQRDALAFNAAEAGLALSVQELLTGRSASAAEGAARAEVERRTLGWQGPWQRVEIRSIGRSGGRSVGVVAVVDARRPPPGETQPPPRVRLRTWRRLPRNAID